MKVISSRSAACGDGDAYLSMILAVEGTPLVSVVGSTIDVSVDCVCVCVFVCLRACVRACVRACMFIHEWC